MAPRAPRRDGDPVERNRAHRALKATGVVASSVLPSALEKTPPLPRVVVKRLHPGYVHPVNRTEVIGLLRFLGPRCTYGLRSVELVSSPDVPTTARVLLGRLLVPGRIQLYAQPASPWVLPGSLHHAEAERLARAGALVQFADGGSQTVVSWPGRTLRDFMLLDVLLHELAHHAIQQDNWKWATRAARTSDHEALATRLAGRWRREYLEALPFGP